MSETIKDATAGIGKALREDGAIGSSFKSDGAIGSVGQAVGGPFDKNGMIGQQFTTEGSIGGTAQMMGENISGSAASAKANPQDGIADRTTIPKDR